MRLELVSKEDNPTVKKLIIRALVKFGFLIGPVVIAAIVVWGLSLFGLAEYLVHQIGIGVLGIGYCYYVWKNLSLFWVSEEHQFVHDCFVGLGLKDSSDPKQSDS